MQRKSGENQRAMSVMDEQVPRSAETVERLGKPFIRRITRLANFTALGFVIVGAVVLGGVLLLAKSDDEEARRQALTAAVVGFAFIGLLPAWVIRRFFLRDAKDAPGLLRDGVAYPALVKRARRNGRGMSFVTVAWNEQGHEASAVVEIAGPTPTEHHAVTVLAKPTGSAIGVAFGDEFFVGKRRRR